MSEGVEVAKVGRAMEILLRGVGQPILFKDHARGAVFATPADSAAAADGLLPVFLVAAEAVWREAVGDGFRLEIARDPDALFDYRVTKIGAARITDVLLALMEAAAQALRPDGIVVNELANVWEEALERAEAREKAKAADLQGRA
jgi:hypothetical protein